VVLLSLCLVSAFFYSLSPTLHLRIKTLLERRRQAKTVTAEMRTEEEELKRILEGR
jgi:hypothetical protein